MSEAAREAKISEALDALGTDPNQERSQIRFRGADTILPVVRLPLEAVVLNANSHRIKSQLESHELRDLVSSEPYSEEAQTVISQLLAHTEKFNDLLVNLNEDGQRDPGVITRKGVLVNANTRVAALREIDPHGHVRVMVLPPNAEPKDIAKLELDLQIRKDFRQDYTFTNELLFIDELKTTFGYSDSDAAKALNWAASSDERQLRDGMKRVQQSTRMLATVRELQGRSGGTIRLTYFDDKRQALIDLDDEYGAARQRDAAAAENMREGRLFGILIGGKYRDLRTLSAATIQDQLVPTLKENEEVGAIVDGVLAKATENIKMPGLDDLFLEDVPDEVDPPVDMSPLVNTVAKALGTGTVVFENDGGEPVELETDSFVEALQESLEEAAAIIKADSKTVDSLTGPAKYLDGARRAVKKAHASYKAVAGKSGFAAGKFEYQLNHLEREVQALRAEVDSQKSGA
jgi:hypothetical protein